MQSLPQWAEPPITINQAAGALGISRASLDFALKSPSVNEGLHYELRGNRKVFYREHILEMRKVLTQCALKSPHGLVKSGLGLLTGATPTGNGSDTLSKLRMLAAQKKKERT